MDWYSYQLPLWVVAFIIAAKTLVLVSVHKRMSRSDKLSLAIPGLCLAGIYLVLQFAPLEIEIRRFFANNGIGVLFTWYMIKLISTRKHHADHI